MAGYNVLQFIVINNNNVMMLNVYHCIISLNDISFMNVVFSYNNNLKQSSIYHLPRHQVLHYRLD